MSSSLSQRTGRPTSLADYVRGICEYSCAPAEVVIGLHLSSRFDSYRAAMNLFAPTGTDGREKS
jgi:hypothetical protein